MPLLRPPRTARLAAALAAAAVLAGSALPAGPAAGAVGRAAPAAARLTSLALGYDRLGVLRAGVWHLSGSLGSAAVAGGPGFRPGDLPVAGDTDGDGEDSLSVFRRGLWVVRDVPGGPTHVVAFGAPTDAPVLGDWDGDGVDTPGVFRRGSWVLSAGRPGVAPSRLSFGLAGDRPVVGDWDGDGRTDLGVQRGNRFFLRVGGVVLSPFAYGAAGDLPVAGDWDHDGRDQVGVFRDGTWSMRTADGRTARTAFGQAGDLPVVRRNRGLAPGVTHQVLRDPAGPFVAHVARIALAAASTPDLVLGGGRLAGVEATSSMGRRSGAVLAVNGDFFFDSGRPVHAFAADGDLVQTQPGHGAGELVGLGAGDGAVSMGLPRVQVSVSGDGSSGGSGVAVTRWNDGPAPGAELAGWTAASAGLLTLPATSCWARLEPAGSLTLATPGDLRRDLRVRATGCLAPPAPSAAGVVLTSGPTGAGAGFLTGLAAEQVVHLSSVLGFPGAAAAVGGSPQLVVDGRVSTSPAIDGQGSFSARNPRTALGVTADGTLLLVVVDGRHPGVSVGMTLRELAGLMLRLGARNAMNLDGGGSSTMWVDGAVANWPSDGVERPVGSAVVVLPGPDRGAPAILAPARSTAQARARAAAAWRRESTDPGGTGGLLGPAGN